MSADQLSRKDFLKSAVIAAAAAALPAGAYASPGQTPGITVADLQAFTKVAGLNFSESELKEVLPDVLDWLKGYLELRAMNLPFELEPPTVFMPKTTRTLSTRRGVSAKVSSVGEVKRPAKEEDLAFMSVKQLGVLIRTRQVTSVELTQLYLGRLKKYGPKLLCVITLLEKQALESARKADDEITEGRNRGPLHGIPCGIKDLFALRGAPTTWGAAPYKDQVLPYDSEVVNRLHAAGAVIVAKLSMGALAQNDIWFKGKTKNPWNPKEGSSGSSAGSAAATAAGLVAFAVGTETLGSIMSPSNRCRVTGLRPTYGRISRYGAMGLSYSMDKVGPICREAEDCALVFAALAGHDPQDRSSVDRPFHYRSDTKISALKIGIVKVDAKDTSYAKILPELKKLGVEPRRVALTALPDGVLSLLEVEAAASFDDLTRSERIHDLKDSNWPESFRASRFVPGVEYLQAQRARAWIMDKFEEDLGDLDILVLPSLGIVGNVLRIANLTGHPQLIIPQGVTDKGASNSVSFLGRIYEEDTLLAFAHAYQELGGYHRLRPDLNAL